MKTRPVLTALALLALSTFNLQLSSISLSAAVLTVTSLADAGAGSLRYLVAVSSSGDIIQFAVTGTITIASAINITHSLNIQGPGPSALVVDANHLDRIFSISGSSTATFISGMTITNGFVLGTQGTDGGIGQNGGGGGAAYGGAIYDQGASLVLSNCWLVGNVVEGGQGGGGGANVIGGTYFAPGKGGSGGGAVGGAVDSTSPQMWVFGCTFSQNRAVGGVGGKGGTNIASGLNSGGTGGGGGSGAAGAVFFTAYTGFTNCTFSGNRVGGGQGGVGGDNTDGGPGGTGGNGGLGDAGAVTTSGTTCIFMSCTIVSNSSLAGPGGPGGNGIPPGSSGNSGNGDYGALDLYTLSCNNFIGNTILADNYASTYLSNYQAGFGDLGYNFIGSKDFPKCAFGPTTQIGTIAVPIHPQLGPLAQNGGGLPTHAPQYHAAGVGSVSPVIDAGYSFGLSADERGAPRPYDFLSIPNASGGDGSDIGAFELGSADLGAGTDSSNNLILSWPAYYGDFVLQSATGLQRLNLWSNVPDSPVLAGSQLVVTNPMTNPMTFYRLISQ